MNKIVSLIAAFMLAAGATAGAQMTDAPLSPPNSSDADPDRAAVLTIVMNAMTQLKLCGLAVEKSSNADVKALCRKVTADNARTALAGAQLERSLGVTEVKLDPQPDTAEQLDALGEYSGSDFDRQFLLGQIQSAESDENCIRYASEFAADPSIKRFETGVLPNVERHLLLAETALRLLSEATP